MLSPPRKVVTRGTENAKPSKESSYEGTEMRSPPSIHKCKMEAPLSPLSSRAKPRDLQFRGPLLEMCFNRERKEIADGNDP